MTWAAKRRLQYLSGLFLFIALILFWILYPVIFPKPTCTDGKKNGDETGVDCGGSCSLMCKEDVSDPIILWSRAFNVTGNVYNLMAFVENQNRNSAIESVSYEFKMYDVKNRLIGRREGTTFISPNKQFSIFEPSFDAGEAELKSVTFNFIPPLVWAKKEPILNSLQVYVDNIEMGADRKSPSLSARIKNESIYDIPSFAVSVILYDQDHNAINVSRTIKSGLASGSSTSVFFTWPNPLSSEPVTEDVLIDINPFSVSF